VAPTNISHVRVYLYIMGAMYGVDGAVAYECLRGEEACRGAERKGKGGMELPSRHFFWGGIALFRCWPIWIIQHNNGHWGGLSPEVGGWVAFEADSQSRIVFFQKPCLLSVLSDLICASIRSKTTMTRWRW
jgi:hypothetical protein